MSAVSVTPSTEVNDAFPSDQMVAVPAAPIRMKEQCRLSGDPGNAYPTSMVAIRPSAVVSVIEA